MTMFLPRLMPAIMLCRVPTFSVRKRSIDTIRRLLAPIPRANRDAPPEATNTMSIMIVKTATDQPNSITATNATNDPIDVR